MEVGRVGRHQAVVPHEKTDVTAGAARATSEGPSDDRFVFLSDVLNGGHPAHGAGCAVRLSRAQTGQSWFATYGSVLSAVVALTIAVSGTSPRRLLGLLLVLAAGLVAGSLGHLPEPAYSQ